MSFFDFFKNKEVREEPAPQPTYTQALEQQSFCDVVQRQQDFLKQLFQKYKYDAMSQSAVFAAINIISNAIAQMPWDVKYYDDEDVDTSYIYGLTRDSNMTKFSIMKNMIKDVLIRGNGFAYIERDGNGKPKTLRYLRPDQVIIFYNEQTDKLLYQVPVLNKSRYIEPINILHFYINSKNGIEGIGVLEFAHNSIELGSYTDKATKDYFKNGMSVQGIIKSPDNLNETRRKQIRKGWKSTDGDMRILEGGLEYQTVQNNGKEAELTANRSFNVIEIARFFNINPILLGDLTHTQYGSIEQANLEFITHTLSSYIIMMEEELNRKLIMPSHRGKIYIDIDEEILIRMDKNSLANYVGNLVTKGIMTVNEARERLGLPWKDGFDDLITYFNTKEDQENLEQEELYTQEKNTNQENEE